MKVKRLTAVFLSVLLALSVMAPTAYARGQEPAAKGSKGRTAPATETVKPDREAETRNPGVHGGNSKPEETGPAEETGTPAVGGEPEEAAPAEGAETAAAPAQDFYGRANGVTVTVYAPEGAFPEGTEMRVSGAADWAVEAAAAAVGADVSGVLAVDVTFADAEGEEIEPSVPVSVSLEAETAAVSGGAVVVHVDDDARAEIISNASVEISDGVRAEAAAFSLFSAAGSESGTGTVFASFEAAAFSVYAIVVTDGNGDKIEDPRYTVEFYAGSGMDGDPYETQIVKAGDSLVRPETPEILEGYNEFTGWYIGGTEGTDGVWTGGTEVQFGPVTEEWLSENAADGVIQIHARFINAIHVTFYDRLPEEEEEDQPNIVTTMSMTGGPIDLNSVTAEPWETGMVFDKWVDENGEEVSTPYTATKDTDLYATFTQGYSLVFDANGDGASNTATQYLKGTEVTRTPATPARPGYTFLGWYTEPTDGTQFIFGSALTADTTVYAHWTEDTASYTVVFWQQKVSDDKNAADVDKTYDYVSSEERSATTGATVSATDADKNKVTSDAEHYTGFNYGHADTNVEVKPDGSTILNVYYDRQVITLNFYTVSYNRGQANKTLQYTLSGLYGSSLNGQWPTDYWWYSSYTEEKGNATNSGTRTTFLADFIPSNVGVTTVDYYGFSKTGDRTNEFYTQDVDGGDSYTLNQSVESTADHFNVSDKFNGFTASEYQINAGNWTKLGALMESDGNYYYDANSSTPSTYDKIDLSKGDTLRIRFIRNTYTIDFMNGSEKVDSASLLYGAALNTVTAPSGKNLTYPGASGDAAAHYTFSGWYTAPVGGTKLDFTTTTETMPANNLVAYAQWEVEQIDVTYDANGGTFENITDNPTKTTVTVDYGTKLTNVPAPYNEGYTFLGWVDEDGNAWNFVTTVTENITLYAKWHTDHVLNVVYYTVDDAGAYVLASVADSNQYDDGATATVRPYGNAGARFVGWSLGTPTGSYFNLYQPGDEIEVSSSTDRADGKADYTVTLYAVFTEQLTTSITFNANGGTFADVGTAGDETYVLSLNNNEGVDLDTIQPIRENYRLAGWAVSDDGGVVYTADGTEIEEIAVDNLGEENILYAVWVGQFYVYHSSDQSVETFDVTDSFDITAKVKEGYLYGGYYSDYSKKGSYAGGPEAADDGTNYAGAIFGCWSSANAYQEKGTAMQPVAGTTYYLKEVPDEYLLPYMAGVYKSYADESNEDNGKVVKLYLISATDDKNYQEFGIQINSDNEELTFALTFTPQKAADTDSTVSSITAKTAFGVPTGYLGVYDAATLLSENSNFVYTPYVVTLDGVTVYGTTTRTVFIGNMTYTGNLKQSDGNIGVCYVEAPYSAE